MSNNFSTIATNTTTYESPMGFGALIIFCIVAIIYFVPAFIAAKRKHNNKTSIIVLNIFLGWTFLGWVIALIWAFSNNKEQKQDI